MLKIGKFKILAAALAAALLAGACGGDASSKPAPPAAQPPAPAPTEMPDEMPDEMPAPPLAEAVAEAEALSAGPETPTAATVEPEPVEVQSGGDADEERTEAVVPPAPVLETATRRFIEAFGDSAEHIGEPSSVILIGFTPEYIDSDYTGVGGTATISSRPRGVADEALASKVAEAFLSVGLEGEVGRVDVRPANGAYARAVGGAAGPDAYVVRAFGEGLDPERIARALERLQAVRYACHAYCADPGPPAEEPAPPDPPEPPPAPPEERFAPPVLRNIVDAPIHTGGAPYPPGTFPPQHADEWRELMKWMRTGDSIIWNGVLEGHSYSTRIGSPACPGARVQGYVKHQILYGSDTEFEDPAESIAAELRMHGIQFESVTVRTAADYAQYDDATFFNWLAKDDRNNDPYEVLRGLNADFHPDLRVGPQYLILEHGPLWRGYLGSGGHLHLPPLAQRSARDYKHLYQVIMHGHNRDVREYDSLPAIEHFELPSVPEACYIQSHPYKPAIRLMLLGLYTTFGDDVEIYTVPYSGFTRPDLPLLARRSRETFSGRVELQYYSATFRETDAANVRQFIDMVEKDAGLRDAIAKQVRMDLDLTGVANRITRIEIVDQWQRPIDYGLPDERRDTQRLSVLASIEGDFPQELPQWERDARRIFHNAHKEAESPTRNNLDSIRYIPDLIRRKHAVAAEAFYTYEADMEVRVRFNENAIEYVRDSYGWDIPETPTMNPLKDGMAMPKMDTVTMNPLESGTMNPLKDGMAMPKMDTVTTNPLESSTMNPLQGGTMSTGTVSTLTDRVSIGALGGAGAAGAAGMPIALAEPPAALRQPAARRVSRAVRRGLPPRWITAA